MDYQTAIQEMESKLKSLYYQRDLEMNQGALGAKIQACANSSAWSDAEYVRSVLTYHSPDSEQIGKFGNVRTAAEMMVRSIVQNCPECEDRTAAIRKVREAMMTANAAIALRGRV